MFLTDLFAPGTLVGSLGASIDEIKLIACFLISYPAAALLKAIPDNQPRLKNLFSICISLYFLLGIFDLWEGLFTLTINAIAIYYLARYMRRSPYMPWLCFTIVMSHMSWSQVRRQQADSPNVVDITGAQMISVIKLSSFCWNVADGMLPKGSLSEYQLERRIIVMPRLLDFLGYIFFFPSLMAGPAFDYAEYQRWLYPLDCSQPMKDAHALGPSKDSSNAYASARKALYGIWWLSLFVFLSGFFHPHILLQPSYREMGITRRVLCLYLVAFTARLKYYGVWTLAEGSCIMAGLGYDGIQPSTGKTSWDKLRNIDPLRVETAQNSREYLSGWNINTNNWLRNYIYLRLTPRDRKPGYKATLATFFSSAVWHGFYPGYYLAFILASLIQACAKQVRKKVRPLIVELSAQNKSIKSLYDLLSWLSTQLIFSFATAPFLLLSLRGSVAVWREVYFYGLAMPVVALLTTSLIPTKHPKATQGAHNSPLSKLYTNINYASKSEDATLDEEILNSSSWQHHSRQEVVSVTKSKQG